MFNGRAPREHHPQPILALQDLDPSVQIELQDWLDRVRSLAPHTTMAELARIALTEGLRSLRGKNRTLGDKLTQGDLKKG
jgi:hypothetical protein